MVTRRVLAVLALYALTYAHPLLAQTPSPASGTAPAAEAPTVVLRLADNSLVVGKVVREDADTIVFDAGKLGQLTLKRADIAAVLDPATVAAALQAPVSPPPPAGVTGFAAPGKVVWTRFLTFGGAFTSAAYKQDDPLNPAIPGLTGKALNLPGDQFTAQGQLTVVRATSRGVGFGEASWTYADYQPFGRQADIRKAAGGYNFRVGNITRLYGVTRYTYLQDLVRKVDYSHQALFGLGVRAVDQPKVKMDLVPGLMVLREKKHTRFDNQTLGGYGGLEQIIYSPNQFAQIEQRELFYQAFTDSTYRGLESYIGFKGMLSKAVGVQIGLSHIYDNVIGQQETIIPANALFPGQPTFGVAANNKTQVFLTAGLLVRF